MHVLLTGGAGFLGSHMADALLARGHAVTALDDLSTGRAQNVAHLRGERRFRFVKGSMLEPKLLEPLVRDAQAVFHLGAAVGVRLVVERPLHTLTTNLRGTELVLEAAAASGAQVVLASTSEVYGKAPVPFREDGDLVLGATSKARWGYAASKVADEMLALAYHRERGLRVCIARLFNTTGPRQSPAYGMVLPRFASQALSGEPLTVYGDGTQRRSFTWVGDAVEALCRMAERPAANGRVINIGHPEETTIRALAELVKARTRSSSPLVHVPYEQAFPEGFEDMPRRVPDLARAREVLGYAPTKDLRGIVDAVVADQRRAEAPR